MRTLDLEAVQAFVLIADLHSFTRAAEALGTSQSAISVKLKRLEDRLDRRLVERTPRQVRLSAEGLAFLDDARSLIAAHERALGGLDRQRRRLAIGISDHVAGPDLPLLLARLNAHDPALALDVRIASSRDLLAAFDQGELDAAIVRREGDRRDGERLVTEPFQWFGSPGFEQSGDEPLRLATLAPPCGVRAIATRALDGAGIAWREVFVGGGVAAVGAAVSAGLGVAALARRVAPVGMVDMGERLKLPPLPNSDVLLYSALSDPRARATVRTLAAAFRGSADRGTPGR